LFAIITINNGFSGNKIRSEKIYNIAVKNGEKNNFLRKIMEGAPPQYGIEVARIRRRAEGSESPALNNIA